MQWSSWKSWALVAAAVVAAVAIYAFVLPNSSIREAKATPKPRVARQVVSVPARPVVGKASGTVEAVHMEWLEPRSGSYKTSRNIFAFVAPPPPPPPPPVKPPPPPPDRDKDGIPDFRDNCPDVYNPDQQDIDHNGVGTACEPAGRIEVPPPPPAPTPPPFPYKYIGTFGTASHPIATFVSGNEIINVRRGQTFGGKFILLNIGIESVDIGFVGFPRDVTKRIPVGG